MKKWQVYTAHTPFYIIVYSAPSASKTLCLYASSEDTHMEHLLLLVLLC